MNIKRFRETERKTLRNRENGEDAAHVCIKNTINTILTIELNTTGKFKTKQKSFITGPLKLYFNPNVNKIIDISSN